MVEPGKSAGSSSKISMGSEQQTLCHSFISITYDFRGIKVVKFSTPRESKKPAAMTGEAARINFVYNIFLYFQALNKRDDICAGRLNIIVCPTLGKQPHRLATGAMNESFTKCQNKS